MIPLLVFYIHIVAAAYVFTKRWQEENKTEAFLAAGFMVLIFFVGWSVATFILKLFIEQEGLGKWFDRDAMSLVLLTILEAALYSMYFSARSPSDKRKKHTSAMEKQKTPPSVV